MLYASTTRSRRKRVGFFTDVSQNKFSYLIALPAIIYVFIFSYCAYPYVVIAFQRFNYRNNNLWTILSRGEWVGFKNFQFFLSSQHAYRVTYNTIYLNMLFILSGTVMAVLIALLLNELRNKWFLRSTQSVMLLPNYISWVVVSYILMSLFSSQYGLVNKVLVFFRMKPIFWYNEAGYWPAILVVMRLWKGAGMSAIIFLAAITGIDATIYEAAQIDGANRFQQVMRVKLPLLMPTIFIMTLLSLGRIMYGDFGMIYALLGDNGMLYRTTDIIDTYAFRALRQVGDPAQAMAIGLFQSAIGFVMVFGSNWLVKRFYPDGALY